ncbi:Uncharacterised protein [Candidatus Ornithobacterium hominis]|uniref:Uncharacterized protein n=1 Tax=Candidatus Ornithobacterium hominis TaxID=2497989 RepID=A0A383U4K6_9FLAO|nr:hypothetical protein [Candidatus Ornithobacterium hominis]MCT7905120.1 hypothetical protein [Candidatus Ornithobacterium hominis]SZD74216.1 Uncharacterised protein [Candidatus Ornithobacterium hominis]
MNLQENLPIEKMKKYGIMNNDESFTKKLSPEDIQKFLTGGVIIAEANSKRLIFQLDKNNTELKAYFYERRNEVENLNNTMNEIQYETLLKLDEMGQEKYENLEVKAYMFNKELGAVTMLDVFKDRDVILEKLKADKDLEQNNRYKVELLKLKGFLQDKIDKFPEIAKDILVDLNIVSKTIQSVNGISENEEMSRKQNKSKIELEVNDPDLYQDANLERSQNQEIEEERKRGFRR